MYYRTQKCKGKETRKNAFLDLLVQYWSDYFLLRNRRGCLKMLSLFSVLNCDFVLILVPTCKSWMLSQRPSLPGMKSPSLVTRPGWPAPSSSSTGRPASTGRCQRREPNSFASWGRGNWWKQSSQSLSPNPTASLTITHSPEYRFLLHILSFRDNLNVRRNWRAGYFVWKSRYLYVQLLPVPKSWPTNLMKKHHRASMGEGGFSFLSVISWVHNIPQDILSGDDGWGRSLTIILMANIQEPGVQISNLFDWDSFWKMKNKKLSLKKKKNVHFCHWCIVQYIRTIMFCKYTESLKNRIVERDIF